ncbi:hypothetical protein KRR55_06265 [Paeniglutamicibacter sp. ABSL32-1]|uniref:hypothetical protein n=1 Tax=Paeniglutamicibacter quisquiliarum TaxID=2849498 RepID=UPI001C2D0353|nr:hypothetical protein [Paeniglutamicibacter quisquiliarum]MBV1778716.1 hypothetical protein [Paeniglutamicibacter quisquiliarum]
MIVGFDYWQVISHYPEYFSRLAMMHQEAGDKVVVISAVGPKRQGTVEAEVRQAGIPNSVLVHEVLFDHPGESPALKLAACRGLGVSIFYDDRDDVCRLLNEHGILALRVPRKDGSTYDLGAERG